MTIHIIHKKSGRGLSRLRYVVDFLNHHPLCPEGMWLTIEGEKAEVLLYYGCEKEGDSWGMVDDLPFLTTDAVDTSSWVASVFEYGNDLLYGLAEQPVRRQSLVIDRRFQLDVFGTVFFHISRYEEWVALPDSTGKAGWHDEFQQFLVREAIQDQPVVDRLVRCFFEVVANAAIHQPTTFSISHDVDFLGRFTPSWKYWLSQASAIYHRRGWAAVRNSAVHFNQMKKGKAKDPYDYFEELLQKSPGWSSKTIYWMSGGETKYDNRYDIRDKRIAALFKLAAERGYCFGLHPSYNAGFKPDLFQRELVLLSSIAGQDIRLNRQHFLRFFWNITPTILTQHRIQQDSSIGYSRHLGFRCGTGFAYHLYDFKASKAYEWRELPMVLMDSAAIHMTSEHPAQLKELLNDFLQKNQQHTHICCNFHNSNFDPLTVHGRLLRAFYETCNFADNW